MNDVTHSKVLESKLYQDLNFKYEKVYLYNLMLIVANIKSRLNN